MTLDMENTEIFTGEPYFEHSVVIRRSRNSLFSHGQWLELETTAAFQDFAYSCIDNPGALTLSTAPHPPIPNANGQYALHRRDNTYSLDTIPTTTYSWTLSYNDLCRNIMVNDWVLVPVARRGPNTDNSLFAGDMHQDSRPYIPAFATAEQRERARYWTTRCRDHREQSRIRMQQAEKRRNPFGPRSDRYSWCICKSERLRAMRENDECGLRRRKFLTKEMYSPNTTMRFKAWYEKWLDKDAASIVGADWFYGKMRKHCIMLSEAIEQAGRNLSDDVWEQPWFLTSVSSSLQLPHHFLHISKKDPSKVAYNADWRGLFSLVDPSITDKTDATNKFIVTTPGKYLTKFFADTLSEVNIRDYAARTVAESVPPVVLFARTEEEIVKAIAEGPTESCMANGYYGENRGSYAWFKSPKHPAVAYAGSGDFEVAYLKNLDGVINARAVCNAKTKRVARIYGDQTRLLKGLTNIGYKQESGALAGCRLSVHRFANSGTVPPRVIMPYVDAGIGSGGGSMSAMYVKDTDEAAKEWMIVGQGDIATYDGYNNKGYTCHHSLFQHLSQNQGRITSFVDEDEDDDDDQVICDDCGGSCDEDDTYYIASYDVRVCESCRDDSYTYAYGRRVQSWYHNDDVVYCESNGEYYTSEYASEHDVVECTLGDRAGNFYYSDDLVSVRGGELAHMDDCVRLDIEDSGGNDVAYRGDVVTTEGGETIHVENARKCCITERIYHENQMFLVLEKTRNRYFCSAAIVDNTEIFSVLIVPLVKAQLLIDSSKGFPATKYDFSDCEFSNVMGGEDAELTLADALYQAYDENHEELEAA